MVSLLSKKSPALALVSLTAAAFIPAFTAHADSGVDNAQPYYTISNVDTHEIAPISSDQEYSAPTPTPTATGIGSILDNTDLADIVNFGKQIWDMIEANKPVVNISTVTANALPRGLSSWENLTGWQAPEVKAYETKVTNLYGMTVVDFKYQVTFTPGGNYQGSGAYMTNITVVPADVNVAWGFKFNAQASVPSVSNAGTAEAPLAAAQVVVHWTIDSVLQHQERSAQYYLRGDGLFEAL